MINMVKFLLRDKRMIIGGIFLFLLSLLVIFIPLIVHLHPYEIHYSDAFARPGKTTWLGTDYFGRDVFSRLVYGGRISLLVGVSSVFIASGIGVFLGVIAGYYQGILGMVLMRVADGMIVFPPIFIAIVVMGLFGADLMHLILVIGFLYAPRFSRVSYGMVSSLRETPYIEATKAIGAGDVWILFRAVLPGVLSPFFVQASYTLANAILLEAGLSFLGLGVPPPAPSWGRMISEARGYLGQDVWLLVWPSILIFSTILSINIIGDALRDSFDPKVYRK